MKITFNYKNREYTLEYDRDTVKQTAQRGLDLEKLTSDPIGTVDVLFAGAFLKHHRRTASDKDLLEEMLSKITDRSALIDALVDMYLEPSRALLDEPEEDEGNIRWGKA